MEGNHEHEHVMLNCTNDLAVVLNASNKLSFIRFYNVRQIRLYVDNILIYYDGFHVC